MSTKYAGQVALNKLMQLVKTALNLKADKTEIPAKTSDLTNDAGFITDADIPEGAAASTAAPLIDGTAAVGTSNAFARGDHVHPSDTSKLSKSGDTLTGRITLSGGSLYSNVTEDTMQFDENGLIFGQGGETSVSVTPSKITVRAAPTSDNDVPNKKYVDSVVSGTAVADRHIVDLIYPVGSIYMSSASISPATLFGGTWVQLKDRFLLAGGTTYKPGTTGGAATHTHTTANHTLTVNEIPAHSHGYFKVSGSAAAKDTGSGSSWGDYSTTTTQTGGGAAHNHGNTGSASNLPPYWAVYMWERTA